MRLRRTPLQVGVVREQSERPMSIENQPTERWRRPSRGQG
jgi:hypothetical protein